ncbi:hypothetical protein MTP05_01290 [Enterococcus sp. PLM3]|nr:hypothetical protein MTP05_01290 [Enterococcus sp. PLM3]
MWEKQKLGKFKMRDIYYSIFLLNLFMRGKPMIEISPEGVKRNYSRKAILVP